MQPSIKFGSSPRVWGKPAVGQVGMVPGRFIPTRVGKATEDCRWWTCRSVHPHACGESPSRVARRRIERGSSPRVWGKLLSPRLRLEQSRFIPTRVGKARASELRQRPAPVHPHACGESPLPPNNFTGLTGSSPRVWGKLVIRFGEYRVKRFIPTRVGKAIRQYAPHCIFSVHPHACGESSVYIPSP